MENRKTRSPLKVMFSLAGLVKPLFGFMVLAIVMGLSGHICATFITVFGSYALLDILGYQIPLSVKTVFAAICLFAVFRGILRYAEQACNHYIAFKLLALIRDKVFAALRRLCPAKLEGRDKGNLISIITSDIELLEVFYAHTISPVAIACLFTAVMCLFIGNYHPALGLIALASYITVGVIIPVAASKVSGQVGLRFRNKSGQLSAFMLDSLRGLPEIIQYASGSLRLSQIDEKSAELAKEEELSKKITGRNMASTNTVILVFDLIMLFTAVYLSMDGAVSFDGVLIPVIALMSSFGPVVALANLGSTLQNTFAAGNRVLDILEEEPVTEELDGFTPVEFNGLQVENLNFSYDDETILSDVSLDIEKDKVIGIVGRSGSGKSTLLKLMMRFWTPDSGNINISGRSIDEINTDNLRQMESFVTQETHLFHDSIASNLRIAKLDATQEEIEEACKKASIHDFIMSLPAGYDTPVGELGDTLSGGEKQRIGLARAFLHDAPLMLLDEPTSNLDSLNEAVILRSLYEESAGKTVVLVSHRKSTMKVADRVISVENGRLS